MGWDSNVVAAFEWENNKNDSSGNGHVLNQVSSIVYSNTIYHNGSYSYNAAPSSYFTLPAGLLTALNSSADGYTIETWVRPGVLEGGHAYMYNNNLEFAFNSADTFPLAWFGVTYLPIFTFATEKETWIHIAITYDKVNNRLKLYKNNILVFTKNTAGNALTSGGTFLLGAGITYLSGFLDNTIFSKTVRTNFPTVNFGVVTVTNCTPASGTVAGGTAVTLTGTGFVTGAGVKFDTTAATSVSVVSATSITCVTPAHAAGSVNITVTNTDTGAGTLTGGYTYISAPTVTNCSSPKYTIGGETITVTGTGFVSGAVVSINGVDLTTSFGSSTSLTATTQAIAAGTYGVTVTNPDTGKATLTNGITFILLVFAITNISPSSGMTNGGQTVTITGSGFLSSALIYIDGQLVNTIYGGINSLQFITPAHTAGAVSIQVVDYGVTLTYTYSFIYIVGAPDDYTVLINGKDVTGVQIKRFTQKNEINFIDRTNLSFNNIEITAPFNVINLFYKDNNNDIVTIKRNAIALFKGYISAKDKNYSTEIYYITASQLLSLTGKKNAALADARASAPVARMVKLLTDYLPVEYTAPQATGLDAYFAGISILLNTGTSDTKLLDVILSICELLDLAIFIDDNLIIKIIPLPLAFSNGKDITEALASLPVIKEKKEYYYNAVSLKYYATVGGAEATATAGSGNLVLNLSFNNIYFDATSASLIVARKLTLRNKIYFEAEFTVNKTVVLNIGDSFAFDIYNFIVIYKEETLTSFKIRGLGAEK